MPHQIILCQDTTYCSPGSNFLVVSLYSVEQYMTNSQTLDLFDWGPDDTNIHSYYQGAYIQSMFSENKTGQTSGATLWQKATHDIASYAVKKAENYTCDYLYA